MTFEQKVSEALQGEGLIDEGSARRIAPRVARALVVVATAAVNELVVGEPERLALAALRGER